MSASRDDFGIAIRSALLQRGAKQKFSLFFLIILSLLIFFLDRTPIQFMDTTRALLNDGIYRFSSIMTSPLRFVSYVNLKTKEHFFVYKENQNLRNELSELKENSLKNEFLVTENKKFQEILETKKNENLNFVISKVLLDKESPFLKSLIINKGAKFGIEKGMPVVEGNYLVGRVVEVNFLSSRVLLLNDLNSKIPVIIQDDGSQAILAGNGSDKPNLDYLPERYEAKEESVVFTSGKDGIFSAGLAVGKIVLDDNGISKVKLFTDPNQLSFVNVILSSTESNF